MFDYFSVRLCKNFVFNISKLNWSWIFILIKPNKSFKIRWPSCTHFSSNEKRISFSFFLRLSNNKWMENKSNLFTCSWTYKEIMRKITRSHENNYGIPPDSRSCLIASKFSPCLNLFPQNLSKFVSRPFFSIRPVLLQFSHTLALTLTLIVVFNVSISVTVWLNCRRTCDACCFSMLFQFNR